jgi:hypothetical protein
MRQLRSTRIYAFENRSEAALGHFGPPFTENYILIPRVSTAHIGFGKSGWTVTIIQATVA